MWKTNFKNWSLSISVIKPNSKFYSLDHAHIKILSGSIYCDSPSLKFKLTKGSVTVFNTHDIKNSGNKDAIFLSIHNNNLYNIPLL